MGSCRKTGTNENVSTYGSAGAGRDYTALATWEAATDNDLVTLQVSEVLECYADTASFADSVVLGDAVTSASYFRIIRPGAGQKHDGTPNSGVKFAPGQYGAFGAVLNLTEDNSQIQDLVGSYPSGGFENIVVFNAGNNTNGNDAQFVGCIAVDVHTNNNAYGFVGSTSNIPFINCLAIRCDDAGFTAADDTCGAYNCNAIANGVGFYTAYAGGPIWKNCLADGNTIADFSHGGSAHASARNNASSDGSADGTGARTNQTFTFVDAGGDDYHLGGSDAGAKGYGYDLSADSLFPFTDDIDGNVRGSTWDIGFHQVTSSGVTLSAGDQIPKLVDGVAFSAQTRKTIQIGDTLPTLTDGLLKLLQITLRLQAGDGLPALSDSAAFAGPFPFLTLAVGDGLPAIADALTLALQERLRLTAGDQVPTLTDAVTQATSLFEGLRYVFLVKVHLDSGTRLLSSLPIIVPGADWDPRILSIGQIARSIEVPAGLCRVADGSVSIADTDRVWRDLLSSEVARGKVIDISIIPLEGGDTRAAQRCYRGEILTPRFPEGACALPFTDRTFDFYEEAIPALGTLDNFPDLPEGSSEIFVPIPFGYVLSTLGLGDQGAIRCPQFDTARQRYAVSRYAIESVPTVYRKTPSEEMFSPVQAYEYAITEQAQTIDGVDYTFVYIDFYAPQVEGTEIRADVRGYRGSDGLASRNLGTILRTFLEIVAAQAPDKLNLISLAQLTADFISRGWLCDWAITEGMTRREALSQLMGSFNADLYQDVDGLIAAGLSDAAPVPAVTFDDTFHLLRESVDQSHPDPIATKIMYSYARLYSEGTWKQVKPWEDTDLAARIGKVIEKKVELWAVRDHSTAADVVADIGSYLSGESFQIGFDLSAPRTLSQVELAAIAGITHYGGLEAPNGYVNKPFKITSLTLEPSQVRLTVQAIRRVSPAPRMGGKLLDVTLAENAIPGPFIYSRQQIFSVWKSAANPKRLKVMWSSDWGESWAEADAAHAAVLANNIGSHNARMSGRYLHCVTQEETTGRVAYHRFDMASRIWTVLDEQVTAAADLAGATTVETLHPYCPSANWGTDVAITTAGRVVVVWADAEIVTEPGDGSYFFEAAPGDYAFPRARVSQRLGAGSWSAPQRLATTMHSRCCSTGEQVGGLVVGSGEKVYHFYHVLPGIYFASTPDERVIAYHADTDTVGDLGNLLITNLLWYPATHTAGWMDSGLDDNGDMQLYIGIKSGGGYFFVFKEADLLAGVYDPGTKVMYTDAPFTGIVGNVLESLGVANRTQMDVKLVGGSAQMLYSAHPDGPQWQGIGKAGFNDNAVAGWQTWSGTVLQWGAVKYVFSFTLLNNFAYSSFFSERELPLAAGYNQSAFETEFGL